MPNQRILSARILQSVLEDKVFFSDLKESIEQNDRAFVNMLVLSSLRNLVGLKKVLSGYLKKKIPHKHRMAEYLLLLAIDEIVEMNTPVYAIISNTVNNVRQQSDKFLAGMANALLRNVCRDLEKVKSDIAVINRLPPEFVEILAGYSSEQISKISQSVSVTAPIDLTVKQEHKKWAEMLNAIILPNGTLRLKENAKITELSGFEQGSWWVQDVAASLPVLLVGKEKGKKVADLCAAPGGKTAQLALLNDEVDAFDLSASRLERMKNNMVRLGLNEKIKLINADAVKFLAENPESKYDVILLDAPCSATGTFRRHPEVLHIKNIQDVKDKTFEQKKLLEAAAKSLNKNGILIYSVCSIAKAEGEWQIRDFLHENQNFKIVPPTKEEISSFGVWQDNFVNEDGTIRTLPYYEQNIGGMDAFFICKLQKIN